MAFNSYHRRGSRSAAQATLTQQNFNEWEETIFRNVSAKDIQVLNRPAEPFAAEEEVSEDSRLYTNEVRSEEFAILSTSSERDEVTQGTVLGAGYPVDKEENEFAEQEQRAEVSNSQRIDDWCVQNDRRALSSLRAPANKRVQEIVEAWGVENGTPAVQVVRALTAVRIAARHSDNYTAHILDFVSPLQRLRIRDFAESMRPLLLERKLAPAFSNPRFKNVPSVFANRELTFQRALRQDIDTGPLSPPAAELEISTSKSQSESSSHSATLSSNGLQSWHGWNIVTRFSPDHIPSY
ncbi:LAFA_0G03796g1_1 [Lachancea sp. 'fantastica']|nr:LAFA_0G03796g1_1 [Lachancea sp. 'fantastica']